MRIITNSTTTANVQTICEEARPGRNGGSYLERSIVTLRAIMESGTPSSRHIAQKPNDVGNDRQ